MPSYFSGFDCALRKAKGSMAAWLDGRKVLVALPLMGLLSFYIYSLTLRETKTQYQSNQFSFDDVRFDLDYARNKSNSGAKFDVSRHMLRFESRQNVTETSKISHAKRLPKAIIIGVRKGGTRALLEFLRLHPKVKTCAREIHFFDNNDNYLRGLEWYRQQMPDSLPGDITIEKTPSYFVTDKVPKRIYEMSRNVKLIVIVRDPTERAISDYVQVQLKKPDRMPSFETFVTKGEELRSSISAIQIGLYIEHLRKWLNYFPISQLHFVSMENMTITPSVELQAVEKFLNLEPFINEKLFYFNETKGFPCFSANAQGRNRNSGCLSAEKGRPHPVIRSNILKLLRDYYRPYNQELYKEVHRDFGWP